MGHTCQGSLLTCIDFRFQDAIPSYMESIGVKCYDRIAVAGATKVLVDGEDEAGAAFVFGQFDISVGLHKTTDIILMNHEDCGAYGGSGAFDSPEDEHTTHFGHMRKAKEMLAERFPDSNIRMVWARINEAGEIRFEEAE